MQNLVDIIEMFLFVTGQTIRLQIRLFSADHALIDVLLYLLAKVAKLPLYVWIIAVFTK
jgi:hypothetical protein